MAKLTNKQIADQIVAGFKVIVNPIVGQEVYLLTEDTTSGIEVAQTSFGPLQTKMSLVVTTDRLFTKII